jgi:6-phosphogluconolactonase
MNSPNRPTLNRRLFLASVGITSVGIVTETGLNYAKGAVHPVQGKKTMLYIGTYSAANDPGIHYFTFDNATGKMTPAGTVSGIQNPSFLAIHPNKKFLYAASESGGPNGGSVVAYSIGTGGDLTLLNSELAKGNAPCHVVVDPNGKYVLVANYSSGTVAALPVAENGSLKPATGFAQHVGSSVNAGRQEAPHAHSINVDKGGKFAVAADLGTDKLYIYVLDGATGELKPHTPDSVSTKPGAGPRHFAFHPSGRYAYAIMELDNTVGVYAWDSEKGTLTPLQTVPTLPEGYTGGNSTAEVQVHPSGKFVYGSNRGHNSIAVFSVDEKTGKLTPAGHQSTEGKTPRNFGIAPEGNFLLAANQDSNNVVVFRIDPKTGALTPTGESVSIPKPVCLKFL